MEEKTRKFFSKKIIGDFLALTESNLKHLRL